MVFAAPDIDMDVFVGDQPHRSARRQDHRHRRDERSRAGAVGRIAGGMTRVGAAEKAAIARLGVRVIDASDAGWGIINHDLFLSNAEVSAIRRSIDTTAA